MVFNMTTQVISSTEANRHFSDLLNRVHYQGQSFDIKRGKEIVARLVPVKPVLRGSDLESFLKNLPKLDADDQADFAKTVKEVRESMQEMRNPWK